MKGTPNTIKLIYNYNNSYHKSFQRLHDNYIVLINRSALKLYDFVRIVLYFECHSKAESLRIEIQNRPRCYDINAGVP